MSSVTLSEGFGAVLFLSEQSVCGTSKKDRFFRHSAQMIIHSHLPIHYCLTYI